MKLKSFFVILPHSIYLEFSIDLKNLENENGLVRHSETKENGNKYGMLGDTYIIIYEKCGKYKTFIKKLETLWIKYNQKYPKTQWKGK